MKKLMLLFLLSMGIATAKAVPFMLYNSGLSSIALEIPGVMNPNLSPLSVSGVGLGVGQKIYYYHQGQRVTLLEVDESLRNQKVNVRKLIMKQKAELKKG